MKREIIQGIIGGICITLATYLYLSAYTSFMELMPDGLSRLASALLFPFGLLGTLALGGSLITSITLDFPLTLDEQVQKKFWELYLLVGIGNLLGVIITYAVIGTGGGYYGLIPVRTAVLANTRYFDFNPLMTMMKAIPTGFLIGAASRNRDNHFLVYIFTYLFVASGYYHIVVELFYALFATEAFGYKVVFLLFVAIGNLLGGIAFKFLVEYIKKGKAKNDYS